MLVYVSREIWSSVIDTRQCPQVVNSFDSVSAHQQKIYIKLFINFQHALRAFAEQLSNLLVAHLILPEFKAFSITDVILNRVCVGPYHTYRLQTGAESQGSMRGKWRTVHDDLYSSQCRSGTKGSFPIHNLIKSEISMWGGFLRNTRGIVVVRST